MDLDDARDLARDLMEEHGLEHWDLQFDRARQRFGRCVYDTYTIQLSAPLVSLNEEHHVRDTILHEIAHALMGPGYGHGPEWRRMARRIGAPPERCFTQAVVTPERKYSGTCDCPGKVFRRDRLTAGTRRGSCPKCLTRITWKVNR